MSAPSRFFIVRLSFDTNAREHFLLVPALPSEVSKEAYALERWHLAQSWLADHPAEIERFSLLLRESAHTLAALASENFPALSSAGIDVLQDALLRPQLRLELATNIAPALLASVWPEPVALDPAGITRLWQQALRGKGKLASFRPAIISLHHRHAAAAAAEFLDIPGFSLPPLGGNAVTDFAIPIDLFANSPRYLQVMNSMPYHTIRQVLSFGQFSSSEDSPWPTAAIRRGSTRGHAQMFPVEMELEPFRESSEQKDLIALMWQQVSELSDLDADILDLLSAIWLEQARSPNDAARVSVKNLLRRRGLKPKMGEGGRDSGFRPDQKQQLFRSLSHIQNLFLLIHETESPQAREHRQVSSRAFIITDIAGRRTGNGPLDIEEFLVRPGVLFGHFLFGQGRQIAILSSKAIEYDRIRQDWEKRLARYFSWQWRNDAVNQRSSRKFLVRTLLENSGKPINEDHPGRTRKRLEKALDTLASDQVIASWRWDPDNPRGSSSTSWTSFWLSWSIEIEAPEFVRKHYQHVLPPDAAANTSLLPAPVEELPLPESLFRYRKENGMSQAAIAGKLGITQSYYSLLERGARTPDAALLAEIERLLHGPI